MQDSCISHLAYANDIILFTNGSKLLIQRLKAVLNWYEKASNQKVNAKKFAICVASI